MDGWRDGQIQRGMEGLMEGEKEEQVKDEEGRKRRTERRKTGWKRQKDGGMDGKK